MPVHVPVIEVDTTDADEEVLAPFESVAVKTAWKVVVVALLYVTAAEELLLEVPFPKSHYLDRVPIRVRRAG